MKLLLHLIKLFFQQNYYRCNILLYIVYVYMCVCVTEFISTLSELLKGHKSAVYCMNILKLPDRLDLLLGAMLEAPCMEEIP